MIEQAEPGSRFPWFYVDSAEVLTTVNGGEIAVEALKPFIRRELLKLFPNAATLIGHYQIFHSLKEALMMIYLRRISVTLCFIVFCSVITFGQAGQSPAADHSLSVGGEVEHPLKLTATDLAKLPRRTVRAKDHDGKEATFEGVELGEVLKLAGVQFGVQMRGKSLALFLVAEAADNYRAVFALPELDHARGPACRQKGRQASGGIRRAAAHRCARREAASAMDQAG
jgi:hypothetical protein